MSEVQVDRYVTVYNDVSEVECGGNVTVYSDVCLRYRFWEMLLSNLQ